LRHKQRNGERAGNIPFGYRLAADGKHIEPDPGAQAAISAIRRLRKGGQSLRAIATSLNDQRHQTRSGSRWRMESVARVLRREPSSLLVV